MLRYKKIVSRGKEEEEKPIDFLWIYYMGVNRLGFNHREIGQQYLGYWLDLFETYKRQYNFEKSRGLYLLSEAEEISSLDAL